jgi:hypothetical protein
MGKLSSEFPPLQTRNVQPSPRTSAREVSTDTHDLESLFWIYKRYSSMRRRASWMQQLQ